MATTGHTLESHDNATLAYYKHSPEKDPEAIIIVIHGMAEHAKRYFHFSEFLNKHSFVVYTYDQRGHGETAGKLEKIGFLADHGGWEKITLDLKEIVNLAKKENPNLPIFLFGHSMGSFVLRTYLIENSNDIDGAILSGTAGSAGMLAIAGNIITSIIMLFKKKNSPSALMNALSFGAFNNAFKPNRTDYDWLSRDEETVDNYIKDPFSGTVFSVSFFKDMINGLETVNKLKNAKKIRKDLPIYSFAGDKDPVSKNGKQVSDVHKMYENAGLTDIETKLYPDARHEMLNEINKDEVYNDILNWINKKIK